MAVLALQSVVKTFSQGAEEVRILQHIDLSIEAGEVVALLGASGSGKTTLLQIAGLLSEATSGTVLFQAQNAAQASEKQRTAWRNADIGFVYQFHHLLPEFTAQENVALPAILAGESKANALQKAAALLEELQLSHRISAMPSPLSGGEQQRVSIARALVNEPALLIADEPTGNLDDATSTTVFNLLMQAVESRRMAALIATHDEQLAAKMQRMVRLEGGGLQ